MLGKSPIKWRQGPDMIIAVDWNIKRQLKQINKQVLGSLFGLVLYVHSQQLRLCCYGQLILDTLLHGRASRRHVAST